jgi:cytochrome c oxidase accessory protein FixG
MEDLYQIDQEYRDHISTVDSKGKRVWVYPKKPQGKYHTYRIIVAVSLLALLFAGPFIKIGGQPFILINIFERKFIIFGTPFWPQDFHLFALALISFVVFIVLFTVVFGRVWCGWACPQTIFMEMVFRKIEFWIEGDANQQRRLDQMPWNSEKILKKGSKHLVYILISLVISHLVMAYLIGIDRVKELVSQSPAHNLAGFVGLMFFTLLFYMVFAFLREQVCVAVCPYGRLQGVFLGENSIAVMYDWIRGEPRGKLKKNQESPVEQEGDCIDCKRCVHVCPTGIDIRNGTQLECVNCTACMDACDYVMARIERPKGLIRLASYNSIKDGVKNLINTRVVGYSVILLLLISLQVYLLTTRVPVETTVVRVPGMLYQEQENGLISNLYNIQFVNKTFENKDVTLSLQNIDDGQIKRVGDEALEIPANGNLEGVFFIELPKSRIKSTKTSLVIEVVDDQNLVIEEVKTNFLGPVDRRRS